MSLSSPDAVSVSTVQRHVSERGIAPVCWTPRTRLREVFVRCPRTVPHTTAEFRRQMVDLVRAGRDPTDPAREFEPSGQTTRSWVAEVDRSEGRREEKRLGADPGLTTAERDELIRLRREVRQPRLERAPKEAPSGVSSSPARDSLVCAGDRSSAVGAFRFMSADQADFPITVLARILGVQAGYDAWAGRQPSARRVADAALPRRIRAVHLGSHETYDHRTAAAGPSHPPHRSEIVAEADPRQRGSRRSERDCLTHRRKSESRSWTPGRDRAPSWRLKSPETRRSRLFSVLKAISLSCRSGNNCDVCRETLL
ncbi:hypothetical protein MPOCJGCO_3197 [Methylobacterium trifolii]|uniref:Transposase n=1 Tax=Methylobacterium trifolii TaxID=1003092 RepID=A0ABQ4U1B8_9HYPH|nr:hypothetical protein MPOCJGCO_3197 [Methylobacterium trifolii]